MLSPISHPEVLRHEEVESVVIVQLLSCVWLFVTPMDCCTPDFPFTVSQSLLKLIYPLSLMMPSIHLTFFCPLLLPSSFPASGSFPLSRLFASDGQSIGASASTSGLPVNIQDWVPWGLASLISLQSERLSRVFSSTTVQKHQFFCALPSYGPTLTSIHDYFKNHSFD